MRRLPRDENSLWYRLNVGLDDDERIVLPISYINNRDLYDQIQGVAYLIRGTEPGARADWVWASSLDRLQERREIQILMKLLVVRVRLPWNEVEFEWLVSQDELDANKKDLNVLEVYIRAKDLDTNIVSLINPREFEENRDRYRIVETRYLVEWKSTPEEDRELLGISENTYLQLGE